MVMRGEERRVVMRRERGGEERRVVMRREGSGDEKKRERSDEEKIEEW